MKQYPSIPRDVRYGRDWLVYDKLDGSNIRAEWSRKKGFYKFGSRKVLLGPDSLLGEAQGLILDHEEVLASIFKKQRFDRVVCFFEFWGLNSFAGLHADETHQVTMFDIHVGKRGIMDPREFEKLFRGKVPLPALLWRGNFNKEDEASVRSASVEGMTFEGVVVKGPSPRKWQPPPMFKVKNQAWIDKVKALYGTSAEELI